MTPTCATCALTPTGALSHNCHATPACNPRGTATGASQLTNPGDIFEAIESCRTGRLKSTTSVLSNCIGFFNSCMSVLNNRIGPANRTGFASGAFDCIDNKTGSVSGPERRFQRLVSGSVWNVPDCLRLLRFKRPIECKFDRYIERYFLTLKTPFL